MFTPSHAHVAERLAQSLRELSLPHALFEVPTVHRSISPKGSPDPVYAKANFISHLLSRSKGPVLYVDIDVVFRKHPDLLFAQIAAGADFAIFNWLACARTDSYAPIHLSTPGVSAQAQPRFFRYSHQIAGLSNDQLICSGAVAAWANTPAAQCLLADWFSTVVGHPGTEDDKCLDFAFNNPSQPADRSALHTFWLPKNFARYAFWIFDEPIIDHPDFPYSGGGWSEIKDPNGRQRVYLHRLAAAQEHFAFPRDCILDTQTRLIHRFQNQKLTPVGRIDLPLWL